MYNIVLLGNLQLDTFNSLIFSKYCLMYDKCYLMTRMLNFNVNVS